MEVLDGKILVNKYVIKAIDDVNAGDTSQVIPIQLPGHGGYLMGLFAKVNVAFAGVTYPQAKIGHVGDDDAYFVQQPINIVGKLITGKSGSQFWCSAMDYLGGTSITKNLAVRVTFSSSSGNLSSLSAGELEIMTVYVI